MPLRVGAATGAAERVAAERVAVGTAVAARVAVEMVETARAGAARAAVGWAALATAAEGSVREDTGQRIHWIPRSPPDAAEYMSLSPRVLSLECMGLHPPPSLAQLVESDMAQAREESREEPPPPPSSSPPSTSRPPCRGYVADDTAAFAVIADVVEGLVRAVEQGATGGAAGVIVGSASEGKETSADAPRGSLDALGGDVTSDAEIAVEKNLLDTMQLADAAVRQVWTVDLTCADVDETLAELLQRCSKIAADLATQSRLASADLADRARAITTMLEQSMTWLRSTPAAEGAASSAGEADDVAAAEAAAAAPSGSEAAPSGSESVARAEAAAAKATAACRVAHDESLVEVPAVSVEEVPRLQVKELKAHLSARGLDTNGKKTALAARLLDYLLDDELDEANGGDEEEGGVPAGSRDAVALARDAGVALLWSHIRCPCCSSLLVIHLPQPRNDVRCGVCAGVFAVSNQHAPEPEQSGAARALRPARRRGPSERFRTFVRESMARMKAEMAAASDDGAVSGRWQCGAMQRTMQQWVATEVASVLEGLIVAVEAGASSANSSPPGALAASSSGRRDTAPASAPPARPQTSDGPSSCCLQATPLPPVSTVCPASQRPKHKPRDKVSMPRRPVLGSVPSNGATVSAAVKLMGLASTAGVSVSQSASGAGSASDAPWWLSELASGEAGEGEGAGDATAVADEQAAAPRSGKRKVRPDIADAAAAPPGRKRPRRNAQPACRENVAAAVSALGLARVNASPDNNNCLAYSLLLALGWLHPSHQSDPRVKVAVDQEWRQGLHKLLLRSLPPGLAFGARPSPQEWCSMMSFFFALEEKRASIFSPLHSLPLGAGAPLPPAPESRTSCGYRRPHLRRRGFPALCGKLAADPKTDCTRVC